MHAPTELTNTNKEKTRQRAILHLAYFVCADYNSSKATLKRADFMQFITKATCNILILLRHFGSPCVKSASFKYFIPKTKRNYVIFSKAEWSKVKTLQTRLWEKERIYFVLGVVCLGCNRLMPKYASPGRTDLEQKSLADERELYKGTASEETRIE